MRDKQRHIQLETVTTLRNFRESYLTARKYIHDFEPKIEAAFPSVELSSPPIFIENIWSFYQMGYTIDAPLVEKGKECKIFFGCQFDEAKFQIQIWIDTDHWQREKLMQRAAESGFFDQVGHDCYQIGYSATIHLKMYDLIDSLEPEKEEIMNWFDTGILKLKQFISDNDDLNWEGKMFSFPPKHVYYAGDKSNSPNLRLKK